MKKSLKIVLSMILTAAMLLTVMLPAFAATGKAADNKVRFNFEKVENGPDLLRGAKPAQLAEEALPKGDVRVSIVLNEKSTIDNGYATAGIAANKIFTSEHSRRNALTMSVSAPLNLSSISKHITKYNAKIMSYVRDSVKVS